MKNKIKRFFRHHDFSQAESNDDSHMNFRHVEDDYKWEVEVGVKDNEIKYVKFIDDGWINQPVVYPDNFDEFYHIVDDWIWDMGIHPNDERRDCYAY